MDSIAELIVMIGDVGMSNKALFVMDMPEKGCISCVIGRNHSIPLETCIYCPVARKNAIGEKADKIPDWCPLKPVPERRAGVDYLDALPFRHPAFDFGWNACIDKIMGGCKDETD